MNVEEVKKQYPKSEFKWGTYKYPIEERVAELMKMCKNEFPNIDNYLLHTQVVDYILHDEMKLERENLEEARKAYVAAWKEKQTLIYESVQLVNEPQDKIEDPIIERTLNRSFSVMGNTDLIC